MSNKPPTKTLTGVVTARGYAIGPAFIYRGDAEYSVPEYKIDPGRESDELLRLKHARLEARRDLENLIAVLKERTDHVDEHIFEGHLMLLDDPELLGQTDRRVLVDHLNAEAAVHQTAEAARAIFMRMNDAYFRERVRDFDDIERRLLKNLMGVGVHASLELHEPCIIVADDLTPSEAIQLPREYVLGFVTNGGSATSHVALLARAMGIPAVTGLGDVTSQVSAGDVLLLNGTLGTVTLRPERDEMLAFRDLVERQREISEEATAGAPAGTLKDGGEVLLCANLHPGAPIEGVRELGARGVGLYRSEYLWLNAEGEPTEDQQAEDYRAIARFAKTLSDRGCVTIRALDIGGDKMVRGISQRSDTTQREANPFLGNRSIRYLLSHPAVMKAQLRAVLRASAEGGVYLMYPMVSCIEELREAAKILESAKRELDAAAIPYDHDLKIGAMIEVPSAAINVASLIHEVDFLSIGTNDLIQYTMAADRGNDAVANLYQPTNPAILRLMRHVIGVARANGKPVGVCGESAAEPIIGVLWAAFGIDILSMSATYIPVISKLLSRLTRADLDAYAKVIDPLIDHATAAEIYETCRAWMSAKIPDLEDIIF